MLNFSRKYPSYKLKITRISISLLRDRRLLFYILYRISFFFFFFSVFRFKMQCSQQLSLPINGNSCWASGYICGVGVQLKIVIWN